MEIFRPDVHSSTASPGRNKRREDCASANNKLRVKKERKKRKRISA